MKTHLLGPYNIITLSKVLVRLSLDMVSFSPFFHPSPQAKYKPVPNEFRYFKAVSF